MLMHRSPSRPPEHLSVLDDFLWREFDSNAAWSAWATERSDAHASRIRTDYARAKALQAALRRLQIVNMGEAPDPEAAQDVERIAAACDVRPTVRADGTTAFSASSSPVADLVISVLGAMSDGSWKRFKRCRNRAQCTASFYDTTKSGTRAWCSMRTCGAREKMRRLRADRRTAGV